MVISWNKRKEYGLALYHKSVDAKKSAAVTSCLPEGRGKE
jgi:hypothetical protein